MDGPPNASSSDDVETTSLGGNSSFEEEEDDAVFSRYPGLKKQESALAATEKQQVSNFGSGSDCYQTFSSNLMMARPLTCPSLFGGADGMALDLSCEI